MHNCTEFMRPSFLNQRDKNTLLKKKILSLCINDGEYSISDLSKQLNASVPTVTKLIVDLIDDGFMIELGKQGTSGGRKPSIYGLNPNAGFFAGVNIGHNHASVAVTDFKGSIVASMNDIPFEMAANEEAFHRASRELKEFFMRNGLEWSKVFGCGFSFTGRVNPETGYSYSFSFDDERPINRILEEDLGVPVHIENDSRAMTYGEYLGGVKKEKNMLFVNVSWGLGMGMVLDGRLYYGKSGFSGEVGHFPLLDNDTICRCGKVGCLETGASGSALHRIVMEKLGEGRASSLSGKFKRGGDIALEDIFKAIKEEDVLAIEVVEEIASTLGRGLAGIINILNPDLVVIGGRLAVCGDYLMLPLRSTVKKLALNIVNQDTKIKFSKLRNAAAPYGDCMLSRSKLLGVL